MKNSFWLNYGKRVLKSEFTKSLFEWSDDLEHVLVSGLSSPRSDGIGVSNISLFLMLSRLVQVSFLTYLRQGSSITQLWTLPDLQLRGLLFGR